MNNYRYGSHVSISPSLQKSIETCQALTDGSQKTFQIFLKAPMKYGKSTFTPERCEKVREYLLTHRDYFLVVHGQYLINFCKPPEKVGFAVNSVAEDLDVLWSMVRDTAYEGDTGVVIHLGKNVGKAFTDFRCITNFSQCVQCVLEKCNTKDSENKCKIILETSTKTKNGSDIFHNIIDFGKLADQLRMDLGDKVYESRIGFCIDTAHIFGSGYDIRTREGVVKFFNLWDSCIGLDRVCLIHLNDSGADFCSCRDLHHPVGCKVAGNGSKDEQWGKIWGNLSDPVARDALRCFIEYCIKFDWPIISETGGPIEIEQAMVASLFE